MVKRPTLRGMSTSCVDVRTDTITRPTAPMLETCLTTPLGDDVFQEDPTVKLMQDHLKNRFRKEAALFFPSGTMSNLCGILAHCNVRGSEMITGANSHLALYEAGNVSTVGGVHSKQLQEDPLTGELSIQQIRENIRGDDQHYPISRVVCIENTHNVMGGTPIRTSYFAELRNMIDLVNTDKTGGVGRAGTYHYVNRTDHDDRNVAIHVDGARIFNAAESLNEDVGDMCADVDSISVCLSKGLGAPVGSVLVGDYRTIEKARRVRKALGGGMRQSGVLAAMGLYALENNVERLRLDRERAIYLSTVMEESGFILSPSGTPSSNLLYFAPPPHSKKSHNDVVAEFLENNVLLGGGYQGGRFLRLCLNLTVDEAGVETIEKAIRAIGKNLS